MFNTSRIIQENPQPTKEMTTPPLKFVKIAQAAEALGIKATRPTLEKMIKEGSIITTKIALAANSVFVDVEATLFLWREGVRPNPYRNRKQAYK